MNSSMMPQDGYYRRVRINQEDFVTAVQTADEIISYIGYNVVADLIYQITGVDVPVNRSEISVLDDNSIIYVMKLEYRLADPKLKGRINPPLEWYEFFREEYSRNIPL